MNVTIIRGPRRSGKSMIAAGLLCTFTGMSGPGVYAEIAAIQAPFEHPFESVRLINVSQRDFLPSLAEVDTTGRGRPQHLIVVCDANLSLTLDDFPPDWRSEINSVHEIDVVASATEE